MAEAAPAAKRHRVDDTAEIVRLDVGGTCFTTTRETLLKGGDETTYFARLLNDEGNLRGALRTDEGRIFIDRDPVLFRHVLQALRGGLRRDAVPAEMRAALIDEAEFFGLARFVSYLRDDYDPLALSPEDLAIRREGRAVLEELAATPAAAETADARSLVDVFESAHVTAGFSFVGALGGGSAQLPLLFERQRRVHGRAVGDPLGATSLDAFRARLELFCGPLTLGLPMDNLIVAGGAVLEALRMGDPSDAGVRRAAREGASDVDLFVIADDDDKARATFDNILVYLRSRLAEIVPGPGDPRHVEVDGIPEVGDVEADGNLRPLELPQTDRDPPFVLREKKLLVTRTARAVTFVCGWPQRHLQLILRKHRCVAEVLLNFDIDCCQVAYDGQRVFATKAARRAIVTGINIADPVKRNGRDYESRLAKYSFRGFAVSVPGLELDRVSTRHISGAFAFQPKMGHIVPILAPLPITLNVTRQKDMTLGAPVEDLPRLLLIDALCRAPTTAAGAADFGLTLYERWQGRHPCLKSTTASMMQVPAETQPFNNSSSIGRVEEFPPLLVRICPYHTTATKYGLHVWNTGLEVCTSSGTPGVLLPYSEQLRTPSRILHALNAACRDMTHKEATSSTLPPMVWDLVDVTDHDSGTPNVLGLMLFTTGNHRVVGLPLPQNPGLPPEIVESFEGPVAVETELPEHERTTREFFHGSRRFVSLPRSVEFLPANIDSGNMWRCEQGWFSDVYT